MKRKMLAILSGLCMLLSAMPVHAATALPINNGNKYRTVMGGGRSIQYLSLATIRLH